MSVERHSECSEHVRSPMVFVDSATALAESQNNSAEFYASLPREKSLLCCVCQKHNTTFRYEVIYKSGPALGQKQPVNNNNSGKFYCFLFVACSTFLEFCLDSVYIFKWIEIESTGVSIMKIEIFCLQIL